MSDLNTTTSVTSGVVPPSDTPEDKPVVIKALSLTFGDNGPPVDLPTITTLGRADMAGIREHTAQIEFSQQHMAYLLMCWFVLSEKAEDGKKLVWPAGHSGDAWSALLNNAKVMFLGERPTADKGKATDEITNAIAAYDSDAETVLNATRFAVDMVTLGMSWQDFNDAEKQFVVDRNDLLLPGEMYNAFDVVDGKIVYRVADRLLLNRLRYKIKNGNGETSSIGASIARIRLIAADARKPKVSTPVAPPSPTPPADTAKPEDKASDPANRDTQLPIASKAEGDALKATIDVMEGHIQTTGADPMAHAKPTAQEIELKRQRDQFMGNMTSLTKSMETYEFINQMTAYDITRDQANTVMDVLRWCQSFGVRTAEETERRKIEAMRAKAAADKAAAEHKSAPPVTQTTTTIGDVVLSSPTLSDDQRAKLAEAVAKAEAEADAPAEVAKPGKRKPFKIGEAA